MDDRTPPIRQPSAITPTEMRSADDRHFDCCAVLSRGDGHEHITVNCGRCGERMVLRLSELLKVRTVNCNLCDARRATDSAAPLQSTTFSLIVESHSDDSCPGAAIQHGS
jgi:hypothetical protein